MQKRKSTTVKRRNRAILSTVQGSNSRLSTALARVGSTYISAPGLHECYEGHSEPKKRMVKQPIP